MMHFCRKNIISMIERNMVSSLALIKNYNQTGAKFQEGHSIVKNTEGAGSIVLGLGFWLENKFLSLQKY